MQNSVKITYPTIDGNTAAGMNTKAAVAGYGNPCLFKIVSSLHLHGSPPCRVRSATRRYSRMKSAPTVWSSDQIMRHASVKIAGGVQVQCPL
jgi:hypothetical protein